MCKVYFKNDSGWKHEFEDVWLYSEWANQRGKDQRDTGIDIVAKRRNGKFCAIQCKFYQEGHRITRRDIDSFFTVSGTSDFDLRIIVDSTNTAWSEHADTALIQQDKPTFKVGFRQLENSDIDWSLYFRKEEVRNRPPKTPRPDQTEAIEAVCEGLKDSDRGKMIMACGIGKTFTSLKIAEELAGSGKCVLFMVPSLALMGQAIRDWTLDSQTNLRIFAVCSDSHVGKRKKSLTDEFEIEVHDLEYAATTNAEKLAEHANIPTPDDMTVVFSTYQSIHVIEEAQKEHGLPEFHLVICDEAHRTTGATLEDTVESNFVKIHSNENVKAVKRLYMTATPRVYGSAVKSKAEEESIELYSMDNPEFFGETLFARGFSWAVENDLLTDYRVVVLAVNEKQVSREVRNGLAEGTFKLDDATKIVGCYKALVKEGIDNDFVTDPLPMKRGLAFCKDIESSKLFEKEFSRVIEEFLKTDDLDEDGEGRELVKCHVQHVDGTFNGKQRLERLDWLRDETNESQCRILTNARCLSEGIDVPALDGIMFLHPRKSQIDVVQAVGRVMRKSPGKKMGYIILPIGVPPGVTPSEALDDNKRYKVIWDILNALRSHDERIDAEINSGRFEVDGSSFIEIIAVSDNLPEKPEPKGKILGIGGGGVRIVDETDQKPIKSNPLDTDQGELYFEEYSRAIMAKIVKKCGRREYWEDWARDIAKIADQHITRLSTILERPGTIEREQFDKFYKEIKDDLNDSVTEDEAIEMLAQHLITKPVFDALFEDYKFSERNSVSIALQNVIDVIDRHNVSKEADSLEKFYESVRRRAKAIRNAEARQNIIVELYNRFFLYAFRDVVQRLGIVYTPIEIVDFILHSVNDLLQSEFNQSLGSDGVHILDPFVGTGTFITRLIQSDIISKDKLPHKYKNEIHANEIVLLAYYIAAINIEEAYHEKIGGEYEPYNRICLTDTFQLFEQNKDMLSELMEDNSARRTQQKNEDIRVIVGNPPYSIGQRRENDNAQNVVYPKLRELIEDTYARRSTSVSKRSLYDSYIMAIKWASQRIGDKGIIAFATNAGWLSTKAADGMRQCLLEEFSDIYVINLRGNLRTSGEESKKEGQSVFEKGTRTPIAITILVKNPEKIRVAVGKLQYIDIGEYLTRTEKLAILSEQQSVTRFDLDKCQVITPNQHGDWLNQRDTSFSDLIPIYNNEESGIFDLTSLGVVTNRDSWAYNFSQKLLTENMTYMIGNYNNEVSRLYKSLNNNSSNVKYTHVNDLVNSDTRQISWTRGLKQNLLRGNKFKFEPNAIVKGLYRPFTFEWLYFNRIFNEMRYQTPRLFPLTDSNVKNKAIMVDMTYKGIGMYALMTAQVPDLHCNKDVRCLPLYEFSKLDSLEGGILGMDSSSTKDRLVRTEAITDYGLSELTAGFKSENISKEDVFYYVYGVFHNIEYLDRYKNNLSRELPRIPKPKSEEDFWAFSNAGRRLSNLHCNYDDVDPYEVRFAKGDPTQSSPVDPEKFYRVTKMKFASKGDKSTVIYNQNITITDIPVEAYDYIINRRSALEWVMNQQCVKTDKRSGIVNDANRYAIETVGDPAYPLKLFQRVITVSLETMKIVRSLPKLF